MVTGSEGNIDYAKDRAGTVGTHHGPGNGRLLSFYRRLYGPWTYQSYTQIQMSAILCVRCAWPGVLALSLERETEMGDVV
jgi:hypothetical protein